MVFSSSFANSTNLSYFFLFFLIIDLYFSIPAIITHICNLTAELATLIGMKINEAKTEFRK